MTVVFIVHLKSRWVRDVSPPNTVKLFLQEACNMSSEAMSVAIHGDTRRYRHGQSLCSAYISSCFSIMGNWLINDINQTMKFRDVAEVEKRTKF